MSDEETLRVYDARAEEYATSFCGQETIDAQLQSFLDALPEKADLLDLGCGPGRSAMLMAQAGHTVLATDASAEMIRIAAAHPGVTARQAVFDDISGRALFDGVWANFSLLHAPPEDLPRHLEAIATALRTGGIFHIGMKTGRGQRRDPIGRLYTYVGASELRDLLKDAGLTPFAEWDGASKGLAGTEDPYIIVQARKDG